ncbi:MAG: CocE/NonD family hydrolase [Candidatus Eremiobacteraeota bacterium]|nr:CocE/NonD family hydrolase [Candidatus Eremiobacteraeota bacterium]
MQSTGVVLAALLATAVPATAAQRFAFPAAAVDDARIRAKAMPDLARAVLASYRETNQNRYLDNRFRLEIVAGQYEAARETLSLLRTLRWAGEPDAAIAYVSHQIFTDAKISQTNDGATFDAAFRRSFRQHVDALDDRTSAIVVRSFSVSLAVLQAGVQNDLAAQRGKSEISLTDALTLVNDYEDAEMLGASKPLAELLVADDDRRRYVVETDLLIKTDDGASICAFVYRPRSGPPRVPTLLQYTIYADRLAYLSEARGPASRGYASVVGFTRGKACSPDTIVPYQHDGADAATLITWIAKQPWSDGRVGMFGGSYNSFVQWAAAKHMPPALKAIMPSVPNAPGIDTPMERNVFQSFSYPWPPYVTRGKWLDASGEGDPHRFIAIENAWYASGKPYRAMDQIDGVANPIWDEWLNHPSYDAYWQRLLPYREEFARIDIPSLTTDGYLSGQDVGGLYYFTQYHKYNPKAKNYLLIGPYDHIRGQRGTVTTLGGDVNVVDGYRIDPAAHIDIGLLRYEWFDYIFRGAPRPAILQDNVNYEVMGANEWKHTPSIDAMHARMLHFHLDARPLEGMHRLSTPSPTGDTFVSQEVNFADRSDLNREPPATGLDTYLGVAYESQAFARPFDLSGLFSGRLDFVVNKRDFDFNVSLYQVTPKGKYVPVTYYQARASYVRDASRRQLLTPGRRQRLDFTASRLTSWAFPAGSRLVVVISIVKQPDTQINYGMGKDVSDESIADAKVPLRIKWFSSGFVDIPSSI